MNRIIEENIDEIKNLCVNHNVKFLFAFGSVCNESFNESSDIDFLISFNQMDQGEYADNYFQIADKLEDLFQRKVDLITDKSLSNPYFIESVNQSKVMVYG